MKVASEWLSCWGQFYHAVVRDHFVVLHLKAASAAKASSTACRVFALDERRILLDEAVNPVSAIHASDLFNCNVYARRRCARPKSARRPLTHGDNPP
jgi:hypothetical protein